MVLSTDPNAPRMGTSNIALINGVTVLDVSIGRTIWYGEGDLKIEL